MFSRPTSNGSVPVVELGDKIQDKTCDTLQEQLNFKHRRINWYLILICFLHYVKTENLYSSYSKSVDGPNDVANGSCLVNQ